MALPLLAVGALLRAVLAVRLHQPQEALLDDEPDVTPVPWGVARERATRTAEELNITQKMFLLKGYMSNENGYYQGNTKSLHYRHRLPTLNMQDSANGFRTHYPETQGSTVMWPCGLALAATWDPALMFEVGKAMGKEFRTKGANVMLGPAVNVHRTPYGGRNWEYMSGEDPILGAKMVPPFIEGVQSQGVMTVVKHFAFNEQETMRGDNGWAASVLVDNRTAWELYYPPFEAAVKAGASAFMCARNKVNGERACANSQLLQRDLKGTMDFKGFVMSDWNAVQSTDDIRHGVDQDMGGKDAFFDPLLLDSVSTGPATEEAVVRIVSAMYHMRFEESAPCEPPNCRPTLKQKARTAKAEELAKAAAASSVVLLKNRGRHLPLDTQKIKKLAVIGRAASAKSAHGYLEADYYSGGGSGHVNAKKIPFSAQTVLEAIQQQAKSTTMQVITNPSGIWEDVESTVMEADEVIVVGATTSSEGFDRQHLNLDKEVNTLIFEAAKHRPTVVLMMTPGAVLTPWRDEVHAIVNLFLGGEATAHALAAVVFGEQNPEGRLPIVMPGSPEKLIKPSVDGVIAYREGLFTSYRSTSTQAAFPFGHGLSYTKFRYGSPEAETNGCEGVACFKLKVTNRGSRKGREVAQAYVQFPAEAEEPFVVLRGFKKTDELLPGQTEELLFTFSERDFSIYNKTVGWVQQSGIKVWFGASSSDLREFATF